MRKILTNWDSFNSTSLIIPTAEKKSNREDFVEDFLKQWLTEKQIEGMGPWYNEMLNAFMTEVLLKAQKVGIEKLLLHKPSGDFSSLFAERIRQRQPLVIIPEKPRKPIVTKVELEQIDGDLAEQVKTIPLSSVKSDFSLLDVVNHA